MPYLLVGKCVHKKNPDGSAGDVAPGGCHETVDEAKAHLRALHANVSDAQKGGFTVKEVRGVYYWTGHPSTNARDRDGEIVSAKALRADVDDASPRHDPAPLRYGHLGVRIGGEPDWRGVVKGVLVEAGKFDDTPLAKAVARYIMAHPDGFDGSGWGMSIGFRGVPDAEGVFHEVRIHERSVLPLSRAANPYTSFAAGGTTMRDLDKAALSELNKILDGGDDDAVQALKAQIAAWEQAKALDESDVQRKDAAPDATDQDAEDKAEVKGEVQAEVKSEPTPPANAEKKAKPPKKEDMEEEMSEDGEDDEEEEVKPKRKPKAKAAKVVAEDLSEDVIKGVAAFIDEKITALLSLQQKANEDQVKAINAQFEALADVTQQIMEQVEALDRRDKGLTAVNEMQRGVLEKLKSYSASLSDLTVLDASDPLAAKKPASVSSDNPMGLTPRR